MGCTISNLARIHTLYTMSIAPLRHLSFALLQKLSKNIPKILFDSQHVGDIYLLAKQMYLSFSYYSISLVELFDLIHHDIWGLHRVNSHIGARYFFTIVDGFSNFTWIHLMSSKFETQSLLKFFFLGLKINLL